MSHEYSPKQPQNQKNLVELLIQTNSFKYSSIPEFPLASGVLSQYYVDCKLGLSYPETRRLVGEMILERIRNLKVDAVGGLLIGAYPIAIAVSDVAYRDSGQLIRAFVIRKEPKTHGLKKLIEGDVRAGDTVVIVDDVITSGQSTIDAIDRSRQEGLQVVKAIAIIDREEQGGKERILAKGVSLDALCTLHNLRDAHLRTRHEG